MLQGPGINGAAVVLRDAKCCALEIPALERFIDELACACLCVYVFVCIFVFHSCISKHNRGENEGKVPESTFKIYSC